MHRFELTFEVSHLDDATEDRVVEALDAVVAIHLGVATLTLEVDATDGTGAAHAAITRLRHLGVHPVRLVDDLVTRSQIAERAGVTRQAVSLWITGQRQAGATFPAPVVLTGGGLWLWGEVVEALRARGVVLDAGVAYPTREDSQVINGVLAAAGSSRTFPAGVGA